MEIRAAQANAFLARPDPNIRTILLFGPDSGLVSERASDFVGKVLAGSNDPFALVTFDSEALASDPPKLAEAAHAISLFGDRRAIRIRASGNRSIVPALEPVLTTPPSDAWIVIEAGDLRKTAPLRRRVEIAKTAAAIGCYAEADLDRMIDEELKALNLTIAPEARQALKQSIGADRLQSRSEVRKLCLYAGSGEVGLADVRAIVADAGDSAVDDLIDAAALGDTAAMDRAWRRLLAEGTNPGTIILAAQRHFQALHRARAVIDSGGAPAEALGKMQMPFGGPRRSAVERQIQIWRKESVERAVERVATAVADSRLKSALAAPIVAGTLMAVAMEARRQGRR